MKKSLSERFEMRYQPVTESGCWLWMGTIERNGYCRIEVTQDRRMLVHRLSWQLHCGQIPEDKCVLHRCDVRCCVNPDHLFLGTHKDNSADMFSKYRNPDLRGENNSQAKLTKYQVNEIRQSVFGSKRLSKMYPVSARTIRKIRARTRWGHVDV